MSVNGISSKVINGTVDVQTRDEAVHDFRNNPTDRLLLLSRVASVGLNLTMADVVIFYVCDLLDIDLIS